MIKSCVACGAMLPAGAKVCSKCQWPVEGAETEEAKVEETEAAEKAESEAIENNSQPENIANVQANQQNNMQGNNMQGNNMQQPNVQGQQMYGQNGQMNYNGAQYPYGAQYPGQNAYPNQNPNMYAANNGYPNQQVYTQNGYVQQPYVVQQSYNGRPPKVQQVIPPGSILFRGKVYTEEEVEKMMPGYTKHAIVALIFGILGFLMVVASYGVLVTSLPGFIFSIVGTANAGSYNANPKKRKDGRATTGQVFGILGIVFGVFAMIFSLIAIITFIVSGVDITFFAWIGSEFSVVEFFFGSYILRY